MADRRRPGLSAEEAALWAKVAATVKPIAKQLKRASASTTGISPLGEGLGVGRISLTETKVRVDRPHPKPSPEGKGLKNAKKQPANTLDGGWDRRLARGMVAPDTTLDLHGHTLASAHALLDQGLARSVVQGDRVMLLITGKPPRAGSERPHMRGAIRAAVPDWVASSAYADRIAAVRGAHPRHGGAGALYLIFRRTRDDTPRKS